jgi:hypothetical protein
MSEDGFDPREVLASLRRQVTRRQPTKAEAIGYFADWWEALHGELAQGYHEQMRGGVNHRLVQEDVEHARTMSVWARYDSTDLLWKENPANTYALGVWKDVRARNPQADDATTKRLYMELSASVKDCLASRPKSPDKLEPPTIRPRNYLPIGWPEIRPGTSWSIYLSELLSEKRARAGIMDRQPGEDDDIEPDPRLDMAIANGVQ